MQRERGGRSSFSLHNLCLLSGNVSRFNKSDSHLTTKPNTRIKKKKKKKKKKVCTEYLPAYLPLFGLMAFLGRLTSLQLKSSLGLSLVETIKKHRHIPTSLADYFSQNAIIKIKMG
jgi:hypothetical protein